jgi:hypothetical protein
VKLLLALAAVAVTFKEIPPGQSGIRWTHENGASPEKQLPETVGSGGAFFDYDNDGRIDLFLVNSAGPSALYRNQGNGTFTDVTRQAGVHGGGQFGMGAAAADYDGDGDRDLFVTSFGQTLLYRNNGDGTFTDNTKEAGVLIRGWTTHAVWFDFDNDGRLDLFVSAFVRFDAAENRVCGSQEAGRMHYCIPRIFRPQPSYLFRNDGNGAFTDVSRASGIASVEGKAFGAVATDINNDGWLDLFVANDTVANFLFINRGGKRFEEAGLIAGVAYSEAGEPRSGMGVDATDFDGDGWQDLFVANIDQEMFSLYRNVKGKEFTDDAVEIHKATRFLSGWGLRFFDYDNDGDPDLILANGHPDDLIEQFKPMVTYREPPLLMANEAGRFRDVSSVSGPAFARKYASRGLVTGDYDNDGDPDVLIVNNGEAPLLLRNEGGNRNNWIGVDLVAKTSNPAASGARISWTTGAARRQRFRSAGGSYLGSHDDRELLGLGSARVANVEVNWPSGTTDQVRDVQAGRYYRLVEGSGTLVPLPPGGQAAAEPGRTRSAPAGLKERAPSPGASEPAHSAARPAR